MGFDVQLAFDTETPFQSDWQGLNANHSVLPGYGLTAEQKLIEWDRIERSGVKVVSTWYDVDWAWPSGYPTGSPDYTTARMLEVYEFLGAMQARGVKVMVKMGWHFPQNIGKNSAPPGITPTPTNEATFAAWVSESLHQFINVRGFTNVIGCFFFTEPNVVQIGTIPGGYADAKEYYAHIVTLVRDKIVTDDASRTPIRPQVMLCGPSEFSFTADTWTEYLKANIDGVLDGYSAHSYCETPGFLPFGWLAGGTNCAQYQAWIDLFENWADDANPEPLYADEGGFLVGTDADTTGYRGTADCGWQWCRLIEGHMQAGARASFIWLLFDQPILGDIVTGPVLKYGTTPWVKTDSVTVKPSWQAISMMANLTGGGGGTELYRNTNASATLHGTAVWIPQGVKNATHPDGEWSFVMINEGVAQDVQISLSASIGGRTLYRYVYSGEHVPVPADDSLKPWDRQVAGVTTTIPNTRLPGHSVVIWSTMNIAAPDAPTNLALTARTSSGSTSYGLAMNLAFGNPTNVIAPRNSWCKGASGDGWWQAEWDEAVDIDTVKLALVATTDGVVFATYADISEPTPLSDYTIEYWDGADWVEVVSVTGNTSPNREHAFTPVSTTKLRVNPLSSYATAHINNVGIYGP
jgi:hypothetical protein